jgi:hypothetical protein
VPLRARDLIENRSVASRRIIAQRLGCDSSEPSALLEWMQSPRVVKALEKLCTSPVMWEDLVLLSANPYDAVAHGELVEPAVFEECGLIEPNGQGWDVNLDLALAFAPHTPLEFGYAATLLSRLDAPSLARVARSVGIGPRTSPIDYVLDIAEACTNQQNVTRHLAFLRESDREPLREALGQGELPTDIDGIATETPLPLVCVDPGEAGARGLLFRISQDARGVADRGVVALELQATLGEWLDKVRPPPEAVSARASTRRPRAASVSGVSKPRVAGQSKPDLTPSPAPASPYMTPSPIEDRLATPFRRTEERRTLPTDSSRGVRAAHVQAAAGVVDLESPRLAEMARKHPDLSDAVLTIIAENLVVLRPGVDVKEWVDLCAARVGFG